MKHNIPLQIITSTRISMRPYRSGDEILLNKSVLESFDELHKWMDWAITPPSIEETKAYVEISKKYWTKHEPNELPFLIFDTNGERLIGAASFNAINWKVPTFEIGYWVNIHHAGQGFITEAVNLLTQYAFSRWNAKRVEIRCDPENTKSAAVPKRLGFFLEANFKNHRIQTFSKKLSGTLVFVRYGPEGMPPIEYQLRDED